MEGAEEGQALLLEKKKWWKREIFWRNGSIEGITTFQEVLADYHSLNQHFQQ